MVNDWTGAFHRLIEDSVPAFTCSKIVVGELVELQKFEQGASGIRAFLLHSNIQGPKLLLLLLLYE
jgi:hypothetical protein